MPSSISEGRGDKEYLSVEKFVLNKILKISGLDNIARLLNPSENFVSCPIQAIHVLDCV